MYAFAISSAATATAKNIPVTINVGDIWPASDPIVKANPTIFSDTPKKVCRSVAEPVPKTAAKKG